MFAAVILAAGESTRMGRSKALLPHSAAGTTFVGYLIEQMKLAGFEEVVVVGRTADLALERAVISAGGRFVANPIPDGGQVSSLRVAVQEAASNPHCSGLLVVPVDMPLIAADVVSAVVARAAASPASIVRAVHKGVHGHPVLFKRAVFDELRSADVTTGARSVVRADPRRVLDVEVDSPGVVSDVDTPADYQRLFGRRIE